MDANVCAAATSLATATTPTGAPAIAVRKTGRYGRTASLRRALFAIVCALGVAPAMLTGAPADVGGQVETMRIVATTSPADPAISSHDSAVPQVALGIISFTHWPTTPVRLHLFVTGRPDYARGLTDTLQAG